MTDPTEQLRANLNRIIGLADALSESAWLPEGVPLVGEQIKKLAIAALSQTPEDGPCPPELDDFTREGFVGKAPDHPQESQPCEDCGGTGDLDAFSKVPARDRRPCPTCNSTHQALASRYQELEEALERIRSLHHSTAYVGGPSEQEAYQRTMEIIYEAIGDGPQGQEAALHPTAPDESEER